MRTQEKRDKLFFFFIHTDNNIAAAYLRPSLPIQNTKTTNNVVVFTSVGPSAQAFRRAMCRRPPRQATPRWPAAANSSARCDGGSFYGAAPPQGPAAAPGNPAAA
jgi:hypothetical protein